MDATQFKPSHKQSNYIWDYGSRDIPVGFLKEFNNKFRAWEERRGLVHGNAYTFGSTLRGAAKRSVSKAQSRKSSKKVSEQK